MGIGSSDLVRVSTIESIFAAAREKIGITEKNFLAWKEAYRPISQSYVFQSISPNIEIPLEDLGNQLLVWGLTPENLPFIAFQHQFKRIDQNEAPTICQAVSTIFPFLKDSSTISEGVSHWGPVFGQVNPFNDWEVLTTFRELLSGKTIQRELSSGITEISFKADADNTSESSVNSVKI